MRTNAHGELYNETNIGYANLAESLGWVVDDSKLYQRGLSFSHGNIHIWPSIYNGLHWRKCQYIHGRASHHKSFSTCEEALQSGFEEDLSDGLDSTRFAKGQTVTWLGCTEKPVNAIVAWAFGEECQFIHIRVGEHEYDVHEYELE